MDVCAYKTNIVTCHFQFTHNNLRKYSNYKDSIECSHKITLLKSCVRTEKAELNIYIMLKHRHYSCKGACMHVCIKIWLFLLDWQRMCHQLLFMRSLHAGNGCFNTVIIPPSSCLTFPPSCILLWFHLQCDLSLSYIQTIYCLLL